MVSSIPYLGRKECQADKFCSQGFSGINRFKKTNDIKQFDPKAKQEVSDSKVKADDPILYPLQAYGPMVEQISKMHVEHALDLFNASEGRYPKDYEEFMARIVKANSIKLPVLPGDWKYAYDVENHKLEVIRADGGAKGKKP